MAWFRCMGDISGLEATIASLRVQISNLNGQISQKDQTISDLNSQLQSAKRWILLGTGTSYNIKTLYPDLYAKLTVNNFMVAMDGSISATGEENEHITSVGVSVPKPTISYNSSTGVLTISKGGELYWEDTANWGEHHTVPLNMPIKVYILC